MSLLGIHFTLMIGPVIAVPAPPVLVESLSAVEVTHSDEGRSGFQLTFQVGRSGPLDLMDFALLANPLLLRPFNRVVMVVTFNVVPRVLMDGVITNVQLTPSNEPGQSTLTVTGEDVSVMMDMEEKIFPWPSAKEDDIVKAIVAQYAQYAIRPMTSPPIAPNLEPPTRELPVQIGTDLGHIQSLAARHGYVFYIKPGPLPNVSQGYWGPPRRIDLPQKALSVNMGPATNVESINFSNNALAPTLVVGRTQDAETNLPVPVITPPLSTRLPRASQPALLFNQPNVRRRLPPVTPEAAARAAPSGEEAGGRSSCSQARTVQGLNLVQAQARAQAIVDSSTDRVVTATGELDALRYDEILEARAVVGLRGAGFSYDGDYDVKSVTHNIRKGEYKQRFTLAREGTGTLTPLVRPS